MGEGRSTFNFREPCNPAQMVLSRIKTQIAAVTVLICLHLVEEAIPREIMGEWLFAEFIWFLQSHARHHRRRCNSQQCRRAH